MRATWRIGMFLSLFGYSGSFSQGLSLDSLIHLGIIHNPDLFVSLGEGEVVASDTLAASPLLYPNLGLEAGYNVNDPGKPKASLRLSQEFKPGLRTNQYQVFKASWVAKHQLQKSRELDIILEIRSAYFNWQILIRKQALQAEVEKKWESLARIVSAKVKEGRLSQADEAQVQLNRAKAHQKVMEYQAGMNSVAKQVAFLTGTEKSHDSLALFSIELLPTLLPLDTLQAWASQNTDLKTLELEVETQKHQVDLEKSIRQIPLTVSVGYDRESDGNNIVGAGLEFPLPFSNRNQAGIARSHAELRLGQSRQRAAEARLRTQINDLHAQLGGLAERYQAYQKEIRALRNKQMELAEQGFFAGQLGIFELSRLQEDALDQEFAALDILQSFYEHWNRLGKAVGGKSW